MRDYRLVLKIISAIFFACLLLAAALAALDAFYKLPLADFLVRKLADIMILCVGAIAGLLAGHQMATNQNAQERRSAKQ